jgi:hypothetical protein
LHESLHLKAAFSFMLKFYANLFKFPPLNLRQKCINPPNTPNDQRTERLEREEREKARLERHQARALAAAGSAEPDAAAASAGTGADSASACQSPAVECSPMIGHEDAGQSDADWSNEVRYLQHHVTPPRPIQDVPLPKRKHFCCPPINAPHDPSSLIFQRIFFSHNYANEGQICIKFAREFFVKQMLIERVLRGIFGFDVC